MKKLLTLALSLLLVCTMFGCTTTPNTPDTPAEKTKITIWGTWTDAQKALLEKNAADFTASQDKYEVVYEGQVYSGYDNTVYQAVMAGAGPDIIIDYSSTAATYREEGKVVDLSKKLAANTIAQLTDGAYEEATSFVDGGLYCYPIVLSGPVLWYNPDILAAAGVEVPTTWEEVWAACETISNTVTCVTDADGKHTFVTDGSGAHIYGFASDSHTDFVQTAIMQEGVQVYDVASATPKFNDPKVAAWLQKYQDGIKDGSLSAGPTTDYLSSDFNAGTIAMYYGSVAGEPYLGKNAGSDVNYRAGKCPSTAGGTPWTSAWNRGIVVFDTEDENRINGAIEFVEYFVSAEKNLEWCTACNYQSNLKWTLALPEYQTLLQNSESLAALEPEIAGSFAAVPAISYVRTALKTLVTNVGAGTDVNEALQTAVDYVIDNQ